MDDITHSETGTVKISECETATRCLICGKEIITPNFYRYPIVCDDCKQAVELIKVLYRQNGGLWDCNQGGSDGATTFKKESAIFIRSSSAKEEKYIEKMTNDLDKNCDAFCCGYSEELPTMEFAQYLYKAGYRKERDVTKEILQKIKELAVDRYDYFGKLRAKNLEHNSYIQDSDVNNENALFDLGEMDAFNCIIDKVKELAKEHSVELE